MPRLKRWPERKVSGQPGPGFVRLIDKRSVNILALTNSSSCFTQHLVTPPQGRGPRPDSRPPVGWVSFCPIVPVLDPRSSTGLCSIQFCSLVSSAQLSRGAKSTSPASPTPPFVQHFGLINQKRELSERELRENQRHSSGLSLNKQKQNVWH